MVEYPAEKPCTALTSLSDAQLSLDELRDMVGREGQTFSNRVSTVSESTKTVICCSQKLACTSV